MDSMGDLAKQMRQIGATISNTRKLAKTALAAAKESPNLDSRRIKKLEATVSDLGELLSRHESIMVRYKDT